MGEGGTQGNKVHKFALNDVSVSTLLSKIVVPFKERNNFYTVKLKKL